MEKRGITITLTSPNGVPLYLSYEETAPERHIVWTDSDTGECWTVRIAVEKDQL